MKPVLTVLRTRIRVGESETLCAQTTQCPRCDQKLCLMWPEYVIRIPLHRVVWLDCPRCKFQFSVLAGYLVPVLDGGDFAPVVVHLLT
jgi:hypothetical protein